jgi:hypothetical protein
MLAMPYLWQKECLFTLGDEDPVCHRSDVTKQMIKDWKPEHQQTKE